jgi:hypothetical protein
MIDEEFLDRPYWRAVCPNLVPEILEGVSVFSWEDDVLGKEAVPEGVETDGGFPLLRFWSRGVERVRLVSGLLSFACHGSRVPLICVALDGHGPSVVKAGEGKKQINPISPGSLCVLECCMRISHFYLQLSIQ